jgi:hypothetical protein
MGKMEKLNSGKVKILSEKSIRNVRPCDKAGTYFGDWIVNSVFEPPSLTPLNTLLSLEGKNFSLTVLWYTHTTQHETENDFSLSVTAIFLPLSSKKV